MEMTRRGFLKFLTSIPAVAVIASMPEAVADLIVEQPLIDIPEDEFARFYIGLPDGTRLPVRYLTQHAPEPVPVRLHGVLTPTYAPTQRSSTLSFATSLQGGKCVQAWMEEVRGSMHIAFRDCQLYEYSNSRLLPIATLRSVYPSSIESSFGTSGASVHVDLILQAVVLSNPIEV